MTTGPARITGSLLNVLGVLLAAAGRELHGYAIVRETGHQAPTVYKMLERLDTAGWLSSRLEPVEEMEPGKPRRRYFVLTKQGVVEAERVIASRR
jgi:PadR family transcriptional regulator PadR